jgi:hypothetical protein
MRSTGPPSKNACESKGDEPRMMMKPARPGGRATPGSSSMTRSGRERALGHLARRRGDAGGGAERVVGPLVPLFHIRGVEPVRDRRRLAGRHRLGRLDGREAIRLDAQPVGAGRNVGESEGAVLGGERRGDVCPRCLGGRPGFGAQRDRRGGDGLVAVTRQDAPLEAAGARRGRRRAGRGRRVGARGRVGRGRGDDGLKRVAVADARRDRLAALARRLEGELADGLQRGGVDRLARRRDHLRVGQRAVGGDGQLQIDRRAFGGRPFRARRLDELRHLRRCQRRRRLRFFCTLR